MALECKQYLLNDKSTIFTCWFFVESARDGGIWIKADDIANFLNYAKPDQTIRNNVPTKWMRSFGFLVANHDTSANLRTNWRDGTIFITELGAYALLSRRTKEPEIVYFTEWLHDEIHKIKARRVTSEESQSHNAEFNEHALQARKDACMAGKTRCDAEKAYFDAELARIDLLALSHRFVDTVVNMKSGESSISTFKDEHVKTPAYTHDGALDLTHLNTNNPTNPTTSKMMDEHQSEIINSVARCLTDDEDNDEDNDNNDNNDDYANDDCDANADDVIQRFNDDFPQRSTHNYEWAKTTLRRLRTLDPTDLSIVKKQKM